ncbi:MULTISPECIES: fasciclin domain-containing protein [Streptomyces]|uniref:Cell surface lipoprotein MPT83 n=1 Tax=Streptomyces albus (strain ATCC 21838 / DSM 41398 / FERM P-419 / JCM 4703 / NBRC 107858) TaxID=1081613 RepID=A0A0B5EZP2_STRA4|nr:fasciclin domain-containing protein [Streptomyces sp. SCSIO ZS0520]AJE83532.1 cell surface lipoprotein MPT83 [Streptomyces albus]AOU77840.1 cell surface lipoprotein MPT83 [Streptomyces albus]
MRKPRLSKVAVAVTAAALLPLSLAACSDDSDDKDTKSDSSSSAKPSSPDEGSDTSAMSEPFGPACGTVPKSGKGSFDGMSKDPVATAASNNPALSTLVTAVKKAGLVDTLNNTDNLTVFAPTNDAFAKIPKADLDKVLADKEQLTKILTYHVIPERLKPTQMDNGNFTTLEKSKVKTSGSGESYEVNDASKVVCGNVQTSNANVYIIDTVLMPKS